MKTFRNIQFVLFFIFSISLAKTNAQVKSENYFIDREVKNSDLFVNSLLHENDKTVFHLISHGKSGSLLINGKWLSNEELVNWLSNSIDSNIKHINIYGCNFGKGIEGQFAVENLGKELNVLVSASDDITGANGDWDLEIGEKVSPITINDYKYSLQSAPFTCDGTGYLVSAPSGQESLITLINAVDGQPTGTTLNLSPDGYVLNALGYNINDNLLYALHEKTVGTSGFADASIVTIDANGIITDLGIPTSSEPLADRIMPNWVPFIFNNSTPSVRTPSGVIDNQNQYYFYGRYNGVDEYFLIILDLNTFTYRDIELPSNLFQADLAFNPVDGLLYGLAGTQLVATDPATGVQTILSPTGPSAGGGGAWANLTGQIFFYDNTNGTGTYMYNSLDNTFIRVDASEVYQSFDATSCFPSSHFKEIISTEPLVPGAKVTFEFSIVNGTPNVLTGTFTDMLDPNLTWDVTSVDPPAPGGGTVTFSGQDLTIADIDVPTLANTSGVPTTFTVDTYIVEDAVPGACHQNVATFVSPTFTLTSLDPGTGETTEVCVVAPLPIELISFEGVYNNGNVRLAWSTATETDHDYFEVFRSLDDGLTWNPTDKVIGAGDSNSRIDYISVDKNVDEHSTPSILYKLRIVDIAGNDEWSPIIQVDIPVATNQTVVYPNPVSVSGNLVIESSNIQNIKVVSLLGKIVQEFNFDRPVNQSTIEIGHLSEGFYMILINNKESVKIEVVN